MALNFDLGKVKDWERKSTHPTYPDQWSPVVESIVNMAMVCDFGTITESNLSEIQDRVAMYQTVFGPAMRTDTVEIYLTDEDIADFVGFTCNVSWQPKSKWRERLAEMVLREADWKSRSPRTISAIDLIDYLSIETEDGTKYVE